MEQPHCRMMQCVPTICVTCACWRALLSALQGICTYAMSAVEHQLHAPQVNAGHHCTAAAHGAAHSTHQHTLHAPCAHDAAKLATGIRNGEFCCPQQHHAVNHVAALQADSASLAVHMYSAAHLHANHLLPEPQRCLRGSGRGMPRADGCGVQHVAGTTLQEHATTGRLALGTCLLRFLPGTALSALSHGLQSNRHASHESVHAWALLINAASWSCHHRR
jgi:hypothetical protein